jgi:exosortase/archaeosortase family protein
VRKRASDEGIDLTWYVRFRLALWLGAAAILSEWLYSPQVSTLIAAGTSVSAGNLGNVYPLAAVLFVGVFVLLRWREFRGALLEEGGLRTRPLVRLGGLLLCLSPLVFLPPLAGYENYLSVAVLPVFMVFWGVSLLINPSTLKITFPYSAVLLAATLLPDPLTALVGGPLVGVASLFSRLILSATGVQYSYSTVPLTELSFPSKLGGSLAIEITLGCSSISSISVFLLLVALMHIDLEKDRSSTIKLAIIGTIALVLLNGLRIAAIVWAGIIGGAELLTNLHEVIGYVIFVGFYTAAAFAYVRIGRPRNALV